MVAILALIGCVPAPPVELFDPSGYCAQLLVCLDVEEGDDNYWDESFGEKGECWRGDYPKTCPGICLDHLEDFAVSYEDPACVPNTEVLPEADSFSTSLTDLWCDTVARCQLNSQGTTCEADVAELQGADCTFDAAMAWICLKDVERGECPDRGKMGLPDSCRAVWTCP